MDESAEKQQNHSAPSPAKSAHDATGLSAPRPLHPPPPTFWPFVTAVGLAACFWGAVLNLFVVYVGIGVFVVGMAGLVGDWVVEQRNEQT